MATEEAHDEAEIRHLMDRMVDAIRATDLDELRAGFARDMVSFDVGPALQCVGIEAKLNNWRQVFAFLQPPLNYEIRDLRVTVGRDVAFVHGINRLSGTLNGNRFGPWVRYTAGLRKIDGRLVIAHDQVSLPVDHTTGIAMLDSRT